jgi:hypothetical protein
VVERKRHQDGGYQHLILEYFVLRTFILAAAVAALAMPAFADSTWTAKPAAPTSETSFVAADVIWTCDKSACQSTSDTSNADYSAACRQVAKRVGVLTAFTGAKPFTADQLAKCNASAPKTTKP